MLPYSPKADSEYINSLSTQKLTAISREIFIGRDQIGDLDGRTKTSYQVV